MPKAFDFDATLKDLFQRDRPTLLRRLSHGVRVTWIMHTISVSSADPLG
jgi:hypothetical protein